MLFPFDDELISVLAFTVPGVTTIVGGLTITVPIEHHG